MIKSKLITKLVIQTEQQITRYTAFNDPIASFLSLKGGASKDLKQINDNEQKLALLKSGPINVLVDKSSKVITQFI